MVTTRQLRELIGENEEFILRQLPPAVPRPRLREPSPPHKALILYGVRRSGKSYLLFDCFRQAPTSSLYLDFEDDRLAGFGLTDCELILEAFYAEKTGLTPRSQPTFLLDEIQAVTGWEKFVRRLVEKEGIRVIVTGSSSRMVPREFHTALRGRVWSREVLPFSFAEYLTAVGEPPLSGRTPHGRVKARLKNRLLEYLQYGGFPEVALAGTPYLKRKLVTDYLDAMYFRDLVERYQLTNIPLLEALKEQLFSSFAAKCSITSFCRQFKGKFPFSKDSVFSYYHCFLESMLVWEVRKFSGSSFQRMRNPAKCYLVDTGLARRLTSPDYGRLLENTVFLELHRRGYELFYDADERECDFIASRGSEQWPLQVTWEINEGNREREVDGLVQACKKLRKRQGLILTFEQEGRETRAGIGITLVPAWRWLLGEKD